MEHLLEYATARQKEIIQAVIAEGGVMNRAAEKLGIAIGTVDSAVKRAQARAALKANSPEHKLVYPLAPGEIFKGRSVLTKTPDGDTVWIKTKIDAERQLEMMREAIEALKDDLPKVAPAPRGTQPADEYLLAVYPLGDPHIGMRAWGEECGQDWDLEIAEQAFLSIFDRLVKSAPRCKQAVIVNLGDYFHADNVAGVTERSGHHLDLDGRYAKMIGVGMRIIRRMIESALEHHDTVRVINAIGNHDDTGAMFLSVALAHIYDREPRLTVDTSPSAFHYVKHGKVLFGVHHGHTCKADKLPMVMATDKPEEWGEAEYRYWYTGHIHHDSLKEYPGCKVESFRTLAAKDSYATWNGYRAGQDSKCIVLHELEGEVERHTVSLKPIRRVRKC